MITTQIMSIPKGINEERESDLPPDTRTNKGRPFTGALILPIGMV